MTHVRDLKDNRKKEIKRTKHKKPKSKFSIIFIIFWLSIIGLSFVLVVGLIDDYNELRAEAVRLDTDITQLTATNEELQLQIDFFDSYAYIEQQARERLRMVRPDQIVFRNIAME